MVITDADGTYPIERLPDFYSEFRKGYDMVVGARQGKNLDAHFLKKMLRKVLKILGEFTSGSKIDDINSGFRIFSKKTIMPFFPHLSDAFSFTTSLTLCYRLTHKSVLFLPMDYHQRIGTGKVHLVRDILRTLQYVVEIILYYNPIKLFLCFAVMFFLLGGAVGVSATLPLWTAVRFPFSTLSLYWGAAFLWMFSFLLMVFGLLSVQLRQIAHGSRAPEGQRPEGL